MNAPEESKKSSTRWPWICLALAMTWVAIVRIPLILNAEAHLDSDLAVDGLTLLEATHGHLRSHFPGTPHMGTPPILLALPQAMIFGANAYTITSGGVVAYELVVLATFLLAWRVFGPSTAAWSLIPVAFASVGTIWLSGRLTGGHLMTVAWFATALGILHSCVSRGGIVRAAILGLWLGFGIYLDQMTLAASFAVVFSVTLLRPSQGPWWRVIPLSVVFCIGFAIGYLPRDFVMRTNPHDAYSGQFDSIFLSTSSAKPGKGLNLSVASVLAQRHAAILATECLPRLITGHRLDSFSTDPNPSSLPGSAGRPVAPNLGLGAVITCLLSALFLVSLIAVARESFDFQQPERATVQLAMILTVIAVVAGFIISRNIYNSDNYRYLVLLLIPWCLGLGKILDGLSRRGTGGWVGSFALAGLIAVLITWDTADWYRRFGWIDSSLRPVRVIVDDPTRQWLSEHPEVSAIYGDYWDVYRLAFLVGGRVRGIPYPGYPDRYDTAKDYPGRRPNVTIIRSRDNGPFYRQQALHDGARELFRDRNVHIMEWPYVP